MKNCKGKIVLFFIMALCGAAIAYLLLNYRNTPSSEEGTAQKQLKDKREIKSCCTETNLSNFQKPICRGHRKDNGIICIVIEALKWYIKTLEEKYICKCNTTKNIDVNKINNSSSKNGKEFTVYEASTIRNLIKESKISITVSSNILPPDKLTDVNIEIFSEDSQFPDKSGKMDNNNIFLEETLQGLSFDLNTTDDSRIEVQGFMNFHTPLDAPEGLIIPADHVNELKDSDIFQNKNREELLRIANGQTKIIPIEESPQTENFLQLGNASENNNAADTMRKLRNHVPFDAPEGIFIPADDAIGVSTEDAPEVIFIPADDAIGVSTKVAQGVQNEKSTEEVSISWDENELNRKSIGEISLATDINDTLQLRKLPEILNIIRSSTPKYEKFFPEMTKIDDPEGILILGDEVTLDIFSATHPWNITEKVSAAITTSEEALQTSEPVIKEDNLRTLPEEPSEAISATIAMKRLMKTLRELQKENTNDALAKIFTSSDFGISFTSESSKEIPKQDTITEKVKIGVTSEEAESNSVITTTSHGDFLVTVVDQSQKDENQNITTDFEEKVIQTADTPEELFITSNKETDFLQHLRKIFSRK